VNFGRLFEKMRPNGEISPKIRLVALNASDNVWVTGSNTASFSYNASVVKFLQLGEKS
jgi:hypothetical protein